MNEKRKSILLEFFARSVHLVDEIGLFEFDAIGTTETEGSLSLSNDLIAVGT